MHQLQNSGMVNEDDFEAIAHKNAERLLDLRITEGNEVGMDTIGENGEDGYRLRPWLSTESSTGLSTMNDLASSPLETVRE